MKRYKYRFERLDPDSNELTETRMNQLGDEGFKLVSIELKPSGAWAFATFMKEVEGSTRDSVGERRLEPEL